MYDFSRQMRGALTTGLLLMTQPLLVTTALAQQQKPNILFILADNIGYGDVGVYGGGELRGAPTPRIDQLAAEGLRLTQYLIEPACTPSRAAWMTARYSIRSGLFQANSTPRRWGMSTIKTIRLGLPASLASVMVMSTASAQLTRAMR